MGSNRRQFLTLTAAAPLAWPLAGLARPAGPTSTLGGHAFGSYWRVRCAGDRGADRTRAHFEAVIESVDRAMSPYRADSELTLFNAAGSTDWVPASRPLQDVVAAALSVAQRCRGSFDPTVGPLVGRYGFGPITGRRHGSYRQLSVRPGAIRKDDPGLSVDLCGIAKGHALDRIVAALDADGISGYLIELGGELAARGLHPSGRRWQVAIEDPRAGSVGLAHGVALDGLAIATSGNKVNGYDLAGRRHGHIIDPLTASCVGTDLLSVSVMADRAMLADGLATGMMAMGLDRAVALAEAQAIDALLLVRDGKGLKSITTGRFADRILS